MNPGCDIPSFISGLTGITTAMVRQAPPFEALAERIDAFCRDRVFVAHSVNFDYPIVKKEFERCGIAFARKKLCTVRLSRKIFPGLRSYSLGKLCSSLDIPLTDRHRAAGDARATAFLLARILRQPEAEKTISHFLNARSQEATLPPHLSRENFEQLPPEPGIYFFRDDRGRVLYVGKANNLKKRALGHFYDHSQRERELCRKTRSIDFTCSGSTLLALLMEAVAIKKHFPQYNRAQKNVRPAYGLFSYPDRDGILHLAVNRLRKGQQALKVFYSRSEARLFLEQLCTSYGLCAKYCHLQEQVPECGHFRVPRCEGVCRGSEAAAEYNAKVRKAQDSLDAGGANILIAEAGRRPGERAMIWVSGGRYKGYGFIGEAGEPSEVLSRIEGQPHYPETDRILQSYMLRHPESILEIPPACWDQVQVRRPGQALTFF